MLSPMKPYTDDRREALRLRVREWARSLGRKDSDPQTLVKMLGGAGFLRLLVPSVYGGPTAFVEPLSLAVVREELAFASGLADALFAVQGLGAVGLSHCGVMADAWLPRLGRGESVAAFAVTEPDAGSDLSALTTTATRDGDSYVIEGKKVFISNAMFADIIFVLAVVLSHDGSNRALTAFAVERTAPGVQTAPLELLGSHPVGIIRFRNVRVPLCSRIGVEGQGLALTLRTLQLFRPTVGASACGMAARALVEARDRVGTRQQFGAPLLEQPTIRAKLADMATDLAASRGLVYRAAWLEEQAHLQGGPARLDAPAAMAKLHATETAQNIVDGALQLHGAAGLVETGVMAPLYRDIRALRIYEGASEIQKLVIARALDFGPRMRPNRR